MITRRKFIGVTAAALSTLSLGTLLPSNSVAKYGDGGVVADLTTDWRALVVTMRDAHKLYNAMGRPENVKVINAAGQLCGYGADLIVYDEFIPRQHPDYFNCAVRTRLNPGGRMASLQLEERVFDWGNRKAVFATFRDGPDIVSQAVRYPHGPVSADQKWIAKGLLLTWYLRRMAP